MPVYVHLHIITRNLWERSGSVVKCISRDRPIAGSSLICVTALLVQALISVQALVFDLAQLTCQKRFFGSFMFLFCLVFAMSLCASVYMCFVVTCWERADHLALVCGVYCKFVTFPLVSWVRCGA